jgi:hypothetical protein
MNRTDLLRMTSLVALVLVGGCNAIAGIKAGDPIGSPISCEQDSDCPAPTEPECASNPACRGGKCAYDTEISGKVLTKQIAGDCSQRVCDGQGGVSLQAYDADVGDDGRTCTLDTCAGGVAVHTPREQGPCYTGAAETADVGLCQTGVQHCDAGGNPIGICEGEVAGTSLEECSGTDGWVTASTTVGAAGVSSRSSSIITDAEGNVYLAGVVFRNNTSIDFGGGPLALPDHGPDYAAFVEKVSPFGKHVWSKILPCAGAKEQYQPHLAVAGGRVLVAYTFDGTNCDLTSGMPDGTQGIAFFRLDSNNGSTVSSKVFADMGDVHALAAGSSAVYLSRTSWDGSFIVKVDESDSVVWAKGFPGGYESPEVRLAVLPGDAVAFAGNAFQTDVDLGNGVTDTSHDRQTLYFGVLEPWGDLRWGKIFNTGGSCNSGYAPLALAVGAQGNLVTLGQAYCGFKFETTSIGTGSGYIGSLAVADGKVTWARSLNIGYQGHLDALSVNGLGHIWIGAFLPPDADLGGGPIQQNWGTGEEQTYITRLNETGKYLWTKKVAFDGSTIGQPLLAPTKDEAVLFTGLISGVQSFDWSMVGSAGGSEIVLGKLVY